MVASEGFEPPQSEAQQIYSLLPLTTRPTARAHEATAMNPCRVCLRLEPAMGVEPATFRLQIGCSTVELRRRIESSLERELSQSPILGTGIQRADPYLSPHR